MHDHTEMPSAEQILAKMAQDTGKAPEVTVRILVDSIEEAAVGNA